jgi:hypothetical protein
VAFGQVAEAAGMFSKSCIVGEELIESGHDVLNDLINVATFYRNSGRSQRQLGNLRKSISAYTRSIEIREKLALDHPASNGSVSTLVDSYSRLEAVVTENNSHFESLFPCRRMIALETSLIRQIAITAREPARTVAARENSTGYIDALQFIDSVVEHEKTGGTALFDAAAIYALAMDAASKDEQLGHAQRAKRQAAFSERSLELLNRAARMGLFETKIGWKKLTSDVLLAPLRQHEEFKQLVEDFEQSQDK